MTNQQPLHEPSFADAVRLISEDEDLSALTKQQWVCSIQQIARAFDKPIEVIPARYSAVRTELRRLHHVPLGKAAKTLANHKTNVKKALLWLHNERALPRDGAPLSPEWQRLRDRLSDPSTRYRLSPLMRFCSARGISPGSVDDAVIDDYLAYRLKEMARKTDSGTRRVLARLWNANIGKVDGWPSRRLSVPAIKQRSGPTLEDFPIGFRDEIEAYLRGLQKVRRSKKGQRLHPCKPSTITTRRRQFVLTAKKAVQLGMPIESLTSLSSLLNPDVVERVLDHYWKKNGDTPNIFTVELASHLLSAARTTGCVDERACERLNELREALASHCKRTGLTDKNKAFVRQVLSGNVWKRVLTLPAQLMEMARTRRQHAPLGAAVLAQMAVAIGILSVAPIRRSNLTNIRLDTNLIKPGGPDSNYWLGFPGYDVKNKVDLTFKLKSPELNGLIDEYVHEFRPILLRGSNEDWLFPGERGGPKEATSFATQMVKTILKHTGLRMTVHQFRHAAGALLLQKYPGNYELVRRVLGHKSVQTTIDFYTEFESWQACELFADAVLEHMMEPEADKDAHTSRRNRAGAQSARVADRGLAKG